MQKPKNVFLWGAFDVLHEGHARLFEHARTFGDVYVIVMPDEVVRQYKKTIYNQEQRKNNLIEAGYVREVYIDALPDMHCLDTMAPDLFCFGYDQNLEWQEKLKSYIRSKFPQCEFMVMDKYADVHSSDLREKMDCPCGTKKRWKDCHGI